VRANLARMAAMIPTGQLALPAPPDSGMSRSSHSLHTRQFFEGNFYSNDGKFLCNSSVIQGKSS
jgi:hypothetical protein